MRYYYYDSPIGNFNAVFDDETLVSLKIEAKDDRAIALKDDDYLKKWLNLYFAGKAVEYKAPYRQKGTLFQQTVYTLLATIPFGQLITYGQLAKLVAEQLDGQAAPRAVGQAVSKNELLLIIPCHRVIAAQQKIGGFTGGIDNKIKLLKHEGHEIKKWQSEVVMFYTINDLKTELSFCDGNILLSYIEKAGQKIHFLIYDHRANGYKGREAVLLPEEDYSYLSSLKDSILATFTAEEWYEEWINNRKVLCNDFVDRPEEFIQCFSDDFL